MKLNFEGGSLVAWPRPNTFIMDVLGNIKYKT